MMKKKKNIKVAIGMSGGVDSSVSALLLKEQGYDVTGVYIQCWEVKEDGCAANEDKAYALQTASKMGIEFKSLDFIKEYKDTVIDYFYSEYKLGRTPNPDVMCNKEVKFGLFFDWAMKNGFDYIATGHYAKVEENNGVFELKKGVDKEKDQSYFLYLLNQENLSKTIFPIGDLKKKKIREIALENNLPSAKRPESMGICFIGKVDIVEFLEKKIKHKKGNVLDNEGNVIGEHDGVWFFTIGQRHGFRVNKYFGYPLYVVSKNAEKNELIVGDREDCLRDNFEVSNLHLISNTYSEEDFKKDIEVRIRHLGKLYKADIKFEDKIIKVSLHKSIFGVTPGQSCVFYKKDVVLGGGVIQ